MLPISTEIPKPMVPIGNMPIVAHQLRFFYGYGLTSFKLLVGYKKEHISEYFSSFDPMLKIRCIDTGLESKTAERIWQVRERLSDPFLLTYGDVLSDIDVDKLVAFHEKKQKPGTMAVTPLRTSFGVVSFDSDGIANAYHEKPTISGHWVNAGYFVFSHALFDYWIEDELDFSKGVLTELSKKGLLACFKHQGFWETMDTPHEVRRLDEIWKSGKAPWKFREQGERAGRLSRLE